MFKTPSLRDRTIIFSQAWIHTSGMTCHIMVIYTYTSSCKLTKPFCLGKFLFFYLKHAFWNKRFLANTENKWVTISILHIALHCHPTGDEENFLTSEGFSMYMAYISWKISIMDSIALTFDTHQELNTTNSTKSFTSNTVQL